LSGEYNSSAQRTSPWVTAGRVIFTLALIGCIAFIFSNSMKIASVSTVSSSRVLTLLQAALRRLGHPALAQRLTDHIVRKLAHFCEYMLEGFLLMLCMRVYTRQYIWHISVPMLGGVQQSGHRCVAGFSRCSGGHPYGAGAHGAVQIVVQPS